jgi:mRNA interferase MazF
LPLKFESDHIWIKGDMIYAVGFHRLDFIRDGKGNKGNRKYYYYTLDDAQFKIVQNCVLHGLGLSQLTKHI